VGTSPVILLIGLSDLATGWLGGGTNLDVMFVLMAVAGLYSAFLIREAAARLDSPNSKRQTRRRLLARTSISLLLTFGLSAGVGYAIGGITWAMGFLAIGALFIGGSVALGVRRRRRVLSSGAAPST
jgi:hypothetical protein